jgi:photosystem II stability/assembly factor-like uncharacterized protein
MNNFRSRSFSAGLAGLMIVTIGLYQTTAIAASPKPAKVTVRDIGPEFGVSGAGSGFTFDPEDTSQVIVPTPRRIFRSLNGGMNWSPLDLLTDQGFTHGTLFVRQDPHNPRILFAPGGLQLGLFRSLDFGTTWARVGDEVDLFDVVDCAVSEASSNIVLALIRVTLGDPEHREPLWRSNDGGNTFVAQTDTGLPVSLYDDTGGLLAQPFFSNIATTPADPNVVFTVQFADTYGYYPPSIYKSVDGGTHFTRLEGGPPNPLQVFPHPTLPNVLFVQDVSDPNSPSIYRSLDGGETFEPLTNGLPEFGINNFVALDAHNPSFVFVAGPGGIFKSANGGDAFARLGLTPEQLGTTVSTASVDPSNPNNLYVNTTRGNFKSSNGGVTFAAINNGWKGALTRSIAFDGGTNPFMYIAAASGGGILRTRSRGVAYEELPHPATLNSATLLAISPHDPQTIFAGTTRRLFKTNDGGASWTQAIMDTGFVSFAAGESKIVFDPFDPNRVYFTSASALVPDSSGIYLSTDAGSSFTRTYVGDSQNGPFDIAIDPVNPNIILTAPAHSGFSLPLTSVDGGLNFFPNGPLYWGGITDIAIDPTNSNIIYLAGAVGVLGVGGDMVRSMDGGATYVGITGLSGFMIGLVIDPRNTARVFAWTSHGLFMSVDYGDNWTLLEGNETKKAAGYGHTLAMDPKRSNLLYLAGTTVLEVAIGN